MQITRSDIDDMATLLEILEDNRESGLLREGRFETSNCIDVAVKFNEDADEYELEIM